MTAEDYRLYEAGRDMLKALIACQGVLRRLLGRIDQTGPDALTSLRMANDAIAKAKGE